MVGVWELVRQELLIRFIAGDTTLVHRTDPVLAASSKSPLWGEVEAIGAVILNPSKVCCFGCFSFICEMIFVSLTYIKILATDREIYCGSTVSLCAKSVQPRPKHDHSKGTVIIAAVGLASFRK